MTHVAIIGGGIAGLASALFAVQSGFNVSLFDRVADLQPVGAGILLQPAGLDVLEKLGIRQQLVDQGGVITNLFGVNHKGKPVVDLHYHHLDPKHYGLGIHRGVLFQALFNQIQSAKIPVINPCHIVTIIQSKDKVELIDESKNQYGPYDCVILADGARSRLRYQLKIKQLATPYPWGALWTIAEDKTQLFSTTLEQVYKHTEIMAGILPMGMINNKSMISFFWSLHEKAFPYWNKDSLDLWKKQVIDIWPKLTPVLTQLHSHQQLAFARYYDVKTYPWHDNRCVLIGDAAHGMSPQLGQGANLGLIDAMVLSQCLAQYPISTALKQYTKQRRLQLRYYQMASRFITPWFQSSNKMMGHLRDLLHGSFCKTPILKKQMLKTLACRWGNPK